MLRTLNWSKMQLGTSLRNFMAFSTCCAAPGACGQKLEERTEKCNGWGWWSSWCLLILLLRIAMQDENNHEEGQLGWQRGHSKQHPTGQLPEDTRGICPTAVGSSCGAIISEGLHQTAKQSSNSTSIHQQSVKRNDEQKRFDSFRFNLNLTAFLYQYLSFAFCWWKLDTGPVWDSEAEQQ